LATDSGKTSNIEHRTSNIEHRTVGEPSNRVPAPSDLIQISMSNAPAAPQTPVNQKNKAWQIAITVKT